MLLFLGNFYVIEVLDVAKTYYLLWCYIISILYIGAYIVPATDFPGGVVEL